MILDHIDSPPTSGPVPDGVGHPVGRDPGVHRRGGDGHRGPPGLQPGRGGADPGPPPDLRLPRRRHSCGTPGTRPTSTSWSPVGGRRSPSSPARRPLRVPQSRPSPSTTGSRTATPRPSLATPTASPARFELQEQRPPGGGRRGRRGPHRRHGLRGAQQPRAFRQAGLIVLNDNGRSYSPTVSRLSLSLTHLRLNPAYVQARQRIRHLIRELPGLGELAYSGVHGLTSALREIVTPHTFFEALGHPLRRAHRRTRHRRHGAGPGQRLGVARPHRGPRPHPERAGATPPPRRTTSSGSTTSRSSPTPRHSPTSIDRPARPGRPRSTAWARRRTCPSTTYTDAFTRPLLDGTPRPTPGSWPSPRPCPGPPGSFRSRPLPRPLPRRRHRRAARRHGRRRHGHGRTAARRRHLLHLLQPRLRPGQPRRRAARAAGGLRPRPGRHHRRRRAQPPRRPRHVPRPVDPGHDRLRPVVGPRGRGDARRGAHARRAPPSSASRRPRPVGRARRRSGRGCVPAGSARGDGSVCILAVGKMVEAAEEAAGQAGRRGHRRHGLGRPGGVAPRPGHARRRRRHGLVVTVEDGIRQGGAGMFLADAMRRLDWPLGRRSPGVVAGDAPRLTSPRASPTGSSPSSASTARAWPARYARTAGRHRRRAARSRRSPTGSASGRGRSPTTHGLIPWSPVGPSDAGRCLPPRMETCSTFGPDATSTSPTCSRPPSTPSATASTWWPTAGASPTPQMEERANRLAHHLAAQGVGPGDHVGIYALNSVEWVETAWAVFKLRAVWININYRYVKDELRYLFTNADLVALVHQAEFAPRVAALLPELPALRLVITIDDDSGEPPPATAPSTTRRRWPRQPRTRLRPAVGRRPLHPLHGRDHRHAQGGGVAPRGRLLRPGRRDRPAPPAPGWTGPRRWWRRAGGGQLTLLPIAPLMHGATQWSVMGQSFVGNRTILVPKFDPHEVWRLVETREGQLGHDHRRRHGQAPRRGPRRPRGLLRPLLADRHHLVGGAVLRAGQGRLLQALPQPGDHRRHRILGVRQQRHGHHGQGRHGHEERAHRHRARQHGGVRRGPEAGRARARG